MKTILDSTGQEVRKRVMVVVPAQDQVATGFMYDLVRLIAFMSHPESGVDINLTVSRGTLLPRQRESLVKAALDWKATHILWLDSDMRFPKETLLQLLSHNKPIVGTVYSSRRAPFVPTAAYPDESLIYLDDESTGLVEAGRIGFGCVLTEISVFEKIPEPWFMIGFSRKVNDYMGEDVYFCQVAQQAGYQVLVDLDLSKELKHLGESPYVYQHALHFREQAKEKGFKTE